MDREKHILLIAYVFPPYDGIGGRRWAKHAKALTGLGYTVHVVCARNPFKRTSLWWPEVKDNPNIIIHQLPRRYPKSLVNFSPELFHKIMYKFWVTLLPLLTKGSYLDRTIFWKNLMLRQSKTLIRQYGIRHVICTGGPFGVMYHTTLLKTWFKDLFILNDFRDPWTWGPNWGFPSLNAKRMAYEKRLEKDTILRSDIISAPSDDMIRYLSAHYPEHTHKFVKIPHFYDESELRREAKTASSVVRLVMYGNLYHGIDNYIEKAAEVLSKYQKQISLDIYTDKLRHLKTFKKYGADNVKFHSQLPAKELFEKFRNYDYVFLFNPSYNVNNISTKFYEIIYTRTPIILFCENGLGPEFVVKNNLGIHADLSSIDHTMEKLVGHTSPLTYNDTFDISAYSLQKITRNIANRYLQ